MRLLVVLMNLRGKFLVIIFTVQSWLSLENLSIPCFVIILLNSRLNSNNKTWNKCKSEDFSHNSEQYQIQRKVPTKLQLSLIKCRSISAVGPTGSLNITKILQLWLCRVPQRLFTMSKVISRIQKLKLLLAPIPMQFVVLPSPKPCKTECLAWAGSQLTVVKVIKHSYFWVKLYTIPMGCQLVLVVIVLVVNWNWWGDRQKIITLLKSVNRRDKQ
jgi:hypothetical protein